MYTALIIDDEAPARDLIRFYLRDISNISIVGEAGNGLDGYKLIQQNQPDLLFLDIQMPKINGFEMLELVEDRPLVIFSTAYDQHAVQAFEQNAVDYLLKPYAESRFKLAVEKAIHQLNKKEEVTLPQKLLQDYKSSTELPARLVVKNGLQIEIIPFADIEYIEAQDDYVKIGSSKGDFLKKDTMKNMEDLLPSEHFLRVHRSFIIQTNYISRIEPYSKDSFLAVLKSGVKVSVSRSGYQLLRDNLHL